MKKSLLALAVLGAFAGVASAQSSVTIYGLLDMSAAKANGGTAPNAGSPGATEAWHVQQSAGSRLGFRGNEDMGGGLSAQFQIEHRFNPDSGALSNSTVFWQGRSYVQLTSKAAGSVYLGREYTPAFWPAVKSDPFGWDGVGQAGASQWAGYLTPASAGTGTGGVRMPNNVGYRSPNWGGLTVQAAVSASETSGLGRSQGFNVEYAGGPIYAALGYEDVAGGTNDGQGVTNVAFHWDFGFAKLIAYYAMASVGAGGNTDANNILIGARIPLAGGVIKLQGNRTTTELASGDVELTKYGVGYDYPLSKRTNLYVDFGQGKSSVSGVTNNSAYAFGVKHTF